MGCRLRIGLGTAALACSLLFAQPGLARPSGPLVPESGALFGAFVDPDSDWVNAPASEAEVAAFEASLGRGLDFNHHYYAWTDTFPTELELQDRDHGRLPLITWEPWAATLDEINAGAYDDLIRQRARALRDFGSPVFLRWAHEMNGNWYPWDGSHGNSPDSQDGPAKYVAAWQRLHALFAEEGATNVAWVWSPNAESVPNEDWNNWRNYYPGDEFVDWVGIDGYNWGTSKTWSSWRSFARVIAPVYDDYAASKPIMVAETGSVADGGSKAAWIANAREAVKSAFPSIAAFLYFESGTRWTVNSSTASFAQYQAMGRDPYFDVNGRSGPDVYAPPVNRLRAAPRHVRLRARLSFILGERANVSIRIRRVNGRVVRRFRTKTHYVGRVSVRWIAHARLRPGRYRLVVSAWDDQGNRTRKISRFRVVSH